MAIIVELTPSIKTSLVLLAPEGRKVPRGFKTLTNDSIRHRDLLAELQRLRGSIYLEDGAIAPWQLTLDGRHCTETDLASWHVLALDQSGRVSACARYREYRGRTSFDDLSVRTAALANSLQWGPWFRHAVEREIARAQASGLAYVEVGGWAVDPSCRGSMAGLSVALSSFALGQLLGGCLGISTATTRHHSSSILRRIGGRSLCAGNTVLPPYYDSQYGCMMEVLRFDSRVPSFRFLDRIEELQARLATAPVVAASSQGSPTFSPSWNPLPALAPATPVAAPDLA